MRETSPSTIDGVPGAVARDDVDALDVGVFDAGEVDDGAVDVGVVDVGVVDAGVVDVGVVDAGVTPGAAPLDTATLLALLALTTWRTMAAVARSCSRSSAPDDVNTRTNRICPGTASTP
jgi:hypothetical protein